MTIKIVNKSGTDAIHMKAMKIARDIVKRKKDLLESRGIKQVEVWTLGGLHFAKVSKTRLVPITTMHVLRLTKRKTSKTKMKTKCVKTPFGNVC